MSAHLCCQLLTLALTLATKQITITTTYHSRPDGSSYLVCYPHTHGHTGNVVQCRMCWQSEKKMAMVSKKNIHQIRTLIQIIFTKKNKNALNIIK